MSKVFGFCLLAFVYFGAWCCFKVAGEEDRRMEKLMKEGRNNECKGLSETAEEAG